MGGRNKIKKEKERKVLKGDLGVQADVVVYLITTLFTFTRLPLILHSIKEQNNTQQEPLLARLDRIRNLLQHCTPPPPRIIRL